MRHEQRPKVNPRQRRVVEARSHDPFAVLGLHRLDDGLSVRIFEPRAERAWLQTGAAWHEMLAEGNGLFHVTVESVAPPYRVRVSHAGRITERFDPYAFAPSIPAHDLYLFNEGRLLQAYRMLGSHSCVRNGVAGYRFACWAPNAERVSVVGDFNQWDGRTHQMAIHGSSGVWELFVPGVDDGANYKYEIRHRGSGSVFLKTDPYARASELRPGTASQTVAESSYPWSDGDWMSQRRAFDWQHAAISIYEVHLGSWRRHPDGRCYSYRELAATLIP